MASGRDSHRRHSRPALAAIKSCSAAALSLVFVCGAGVQTRAQQTSSPIVAAGNAAVTGFSGALQPIQIAPGVDPSQKTFIDATGPSLRVVDLQHMNGPPTAQLVGAAKPFTVSAALIGQVFGVALDDAAAPNIYAAASSAYGLPIVAPATAGQTQHVEVGVPNAVFMPALWGQRGGPGSIWKIDGVTGGVSLFANVALDGRDNSGPALGGLAYDAESKSLFVADRETGFIHRFGMDGRELGRYEWRHRPCGTGLAAGAVESAAAARHHQVRLRQPQSGYVELRGAGTPRLWPGGLSAPPVLRGRGRLADLVRRFAGRWLVRR